MEGSHVSILWNREQILESCLVGFFFVKFVCLKTCSGFSEKKEQPRNSRIEMQVAESYLLIIVVTCILLI